MLLVLLTALPWHLKMADDQGLLRVWVGRRLQVIGSNEGIVGGAHCDTDAGVVATVWPLRVGMRAFRAGVLRFFRARRWTAISR